MGTPHLDPDTAERLVGAMAEAAAGADTETLSRQRDALLAAMQAAAAPLRKR